MSAKPTTRRCLNQSSMILKGLLTAYLLVAMGVFSWLPALFFQADQTHQVYVSEQRDVVSWVLHHVGTADEHDPLGLQDHQAVHSVDHPHDESDHRFDVNEVDHHLAVLKNIDLKHLAFFGFFVALLQAFLALWRYRVAEPTGRLPSFVAPLRNSIAVLTRTVVLRH